MCNLKSLLVIYQYTRGSQRTRGHKMRELCIACLILFPAEAQRKPGPCLDGGKPVCANRSRPTPQLRKPPMCSNGASPVCSDGNPPPRPGPCDGGSQPLCGSAQPV